VRRGAARRGAARRGAGRTSSNISTILAKLEPMTVMGSARMSTPLSIATTAIVLPSALKGEQSP